VTPAEAERMIAAQMPSALKRPRSDFVIENDADRATLERRARAVWDRLAVESARRA
jgi:dephospho-CoA kinase